MGIPLTGKDGLYIETGPQRVNKSQLSQGHVFLAGLVRCILCLPYIFLNVNIDRIFMPVSYKLLSITIVSQNFSI